jgi:hypothetical protein
MMTPSAATFMLLVWAVIAVNTGYCFYKLLTSKRQIGSDD